MGSPYTPPTGLEDQLLRRLRAFGMAIFGNRGYYSMGLQATRNSQRVKSGTGRKPQG